MSGGHTEIPEVRDNRLGISTMYVHCKLTSILFSCLQINKTRAMTEFHLNHDAISKA